MPIRSMTIESQGTLNEWQLQLVLEVKVVLAPHSHVINIWILGSLPAFITAVCTSVTSPLISALLAVLYSTNTAPLLPQAILHHLLSSIADVTCPAEATTDPPCSYYMRLNCLYSLVAWCPLLSLMSLASLHSICVTLFDPQSSCLGKVWEKGVRTQLQNI